MIHFYWYRNTSTNFNGIGWTERKDNGKTQVWVFIESRHNKRIPFPMFNLEDKDLEDFLSENHWQRVDFMVEFLSEHKEAFDPFDIASFEEHFI